MLAAGLILAIMVIPFTSSVAREVLKSVPAAQREGAYALGATRLRGDPRRAVLRAHRHRRRRDARLRPRARRDDGRDDGDRQQAEGLRLAVRAAVHDGRGDRQRVHRSGRRVLPARAGRDRARAVHHHADRQSAVAPADLEHGAERPRAAASRRRRRVRRRPHEPHHAAQGVVVAVRRLLRAVGAARAGAAGVHAVLSSSARASRRSTSNFFTQHAEAGRRDRAAAWRTRSSAR